MTVFVELLKAQQLAAGAGYMSDSFFPVVENICLLLLLLSKPK